MCYVYIWYCSERTDDRLTCAAGDSVSIMFIDITQAASLYCQTYAAQIARFGENQNTTTVLE